MFFRKQVSCEGNMCSKISAGHGGLSSSLHSPTKAEACLAARVKGQVETVIPGCSQNRLGRTSIKAPFHGWAHILKAARSAHRGKYLFPQTKATAIITPAGKVLHSLRRGSTGSCEVHFVGGCSGPCGGAQVGCFCPLSGHCQRLRRDHQSASWLEMTTEMTFGGH